MDTQQINAVVQLLNILVFAYFTLYKPMHDYNKEFNKGAKHEVK